MIDKAVRGTFRDKFVQFSHEIAIIYPNSWRFCARKRVAIGLRSAVNRWGFSHNLSLHLTSSIQADAKWPKSLR
jgi:hypothetical protein